jgi:hypothetical protein
VSPGAARRLKPACAVNLRPAPPGQKQHIAGAAPASLFPSVASTTLCGLSIELHPATAMVPHPAPPPLLKRRLCPVRSPCQQFSSAPHVVPSQAPSTHIRAQCIDSGHTPAPPHPSRFYLRVVRGTLPVNATPRTYPAVLQCFIWGRFWAF